VKLEFAKSNSSFGSTKLSFLQKNWC